MNFHNRRRTGAIIALTTVAALALAGCSRGNDGGGGGSGGGSETEASPGITDTTLKLGMSTPLSGPTAGPGSCSVAGLYSYLEAGNAAGGFEFGDGKTRTVELTYLDDAFDPAKAVANFRTLTDTDGVFAYVGALGTPTNGAVMPVANEEEIPQVLIFTGASGFSSDQEANPWTFGMLPTYFDEGRAFGEFLVERGATTVAVLEQNDDYGEDYIRGFEDAIEGSDVEVVATATFESSDPTVDSQITELATSGADVLLSAASITPLQVGVLTKAQSLGWLPEIFLPSNTSTPATVVEPGSGAAYPAVYTTTFSKVPASPAFAEDEDVIAYNEAFAEFGASIAPTYTPHCAWSYAEGAILAEAFKGMEAPTRTSFMESLKAIEGFEAPLMLPGVVVDTTSLESPALSGLTLVKFANGGYGPVE